MKNKLHVEEIKWSVVENGTKFTTAKFELKDIIAFRKSNLSITQMIWITQRPIVSSNNELYNPKSLIMIILN